MPLLVLMVMSILPFSMQPLSFRQTLPDQFHVPLRGGDATLRFLLEGMQHVNAFRKTDRVHGPARVSAMVRNDLDDGASAKPAHGLRRRIGFTQIGRASCRERV